MNSKRKHTKAMIFHFTNLAVLRTTMLLLPLMLVMLTKHDEITNLTVHDLLLTLASKLHFLSKSYSHSSIVRWYANYELWTVRVEGQLWLWTSKYSHSSTTVDCSLLHCCGGKWENEKRKERREKKRFFYFFSSIWNVYYNNLIEWNGSRALWFLVRLRSAVYCLIHNISLT